MLWILFLTPYLVRKMFWIWIMITSYKFLCTSAYEAIVFEDGDMRYSITLQKFNYSEAGSICRTHFDENLVWINNTYILSRINIGLQMIDWNKTIKVHELWVAGKTMVPNHGIIRFTPEQLLRSEGPQCIVLSNWTRQQTPQKFTYRLFAKNCGDAKRYLICASSTQDPKPDSGSTIASNTIAYSPTSTSVGTNITAPQDQEPDSSSAVATKIMANSPTSTSVGTESSEGVSTVVVIVLTVSAVLLLIFIVGTIICCLRRKKKQNDQKTTRKQDLIVATLNPTNSQTPAGNTILNPGVVDSTCYAEIDDAMVHDSKQQGIREYAEATRGDIKQNLQKEQPVDMYESVSGPESNMYEHIEKARRSENTTYSNHYMCLDTNMVSGVTI